MVKTTEVIDL